MSNLKPVLKKFTLDDGNNKAFSFRGFLLGSTRDFHNKGMTAWTDYKVYKRSSGYVCTIAEEAMTTTSIASHHRLCKAKNKSEVVKFIGVSEVTLELYKKIGINNPQKLFEK